MLPRTIVGQYLRAQMFGEIDRRRQLAARLDTGEQDGFQTIPSVVQDAYAQRDRAAPGAWHHQGHIGSKFLTEAILLSLISGIVAIAAGAIASAIWAHAKAWAVIIPAKAQACRHRRHHRDPPPRRPALRAGQR